MRQVFDIQFPSWLSFGTDHQQKLNPLRTLELKVGIIKDSQLLRSTSKPSVLLVGRKLFPTNISQFISLEMVSPLTLRIRFLNWREFEQLHPIQFEIADCHPEGGMTLMKETLVAVYAVAKSQDQKRIVSLFISDIQPIDMYWQTASEVKLQDLFSHHRLSISKWPENHVFSGIGRISRSGEIYLEPGSSLVFHIMLSKENHHQPASLMVFSIPATTRQYLGGS